MQLEQEEWGKEEIKYSIGSVANRMYEGSRLASLLKWINSVLPHLNLPLKASEEELRAWLTDNSVLCSILGKLIPGSVEIGNESENKPADAKRFLEAMDNLGLPGFELPDLEQGSMVPVLQCLETLKTNIDYDVGQANNQICSRKRWDQSDLTFAEEHAIQGSVLSAASSAYHGRCKSNELLQLKRGLHVDLSDAKIIELLKPNSLDNASTQSLFTIANRVLGDISERKNGDVPHSQHAVCLLRKTLQVIKWRFSNQAENLKNQSNAFKVRESKYQSRMNALETLAVGTTEENEVASSCIQQLKMTLQLEKTKLEEKKKLDQHDVARLKKAQVCSEIEISALKQELEMAKKAHEEHCLQLELHANEYRTEYEKKLEELNRHLADTRKKMKELEAHSVSRYQKWKNKEHTYWSFINYQFEAFRELKAAMESTKDEILKTKRCYSEEFKYLGMKLKGLAEAADNYHVLLMENRKLYNEIQDLKGNIRVYCRIRPFLRGQSQAHTTIEFVGDNGELIVSNPLKQGKDNRKLYKFNKVFGPAASQEEVFMDTQPLIRSVLDGYNVCIFAYGQTGSGKTYTMSGPTLLSKADWGVNYRAVHDLFQISGSRRNSIVYEFGVQMVEIYNEQVRDLLSSNGLQKRLGIWNTTQPNGLTVPAASMHSVKSMKDVLELMNIGLTNRATSATGLNERSSRSHSVLTIHVRGMDLKTNTVLRGCLHLVDLAGSERVDRSEATGDRLKEAQHINKSLSALGDVIFALAQKSSHVPYRNSKLTQVLQSSLGGQAKTLMFVQLNPDVASYSETISTLKFAERVSGVELGAARSNKEGRNVRELIEQLSSLKDAVARKDQEIERLQLVNANNNVNGAKCGMISVRYGSSSPSRHSMGTPRRSHRLSEGRDSGVGEKAASDMDNCSEYSDKHSEAGSHQSIDDFRSKPASLQLKLAREDSSQNLNGDIELLGGDADPEERLSDISDGGLSMGTETDGSVSSIVEYTLFPEAEEAAETAPTNSRKAENLPSVITEKCNALAKIPTALQVPQKTVQTKPSKLSLNKSTSKVFSSIKRSAAGSSSSMKPATKR